MAKTRSLTRCGAVRRRAAGAALGAAAVLAVALSACSTTVGGRPESHGTVAASAPPATTTSPSTPSATSSPSTPADTSSAPTTPAPSSTSAAFLCADLALIPLAKCLRASLEQFWSGALNEAVTQPTVLAPTRTQVPAQCQDGLALGTAFTCAVDRTLYVTAEFLTLIRQNFPGSEFGYAIASLQAHEMGHVVQFTVHQPGIDDNKATDAQSRTLEQQADCLSGVWASHEAAAGGMDAARFRKAAVLLITLISSNPEISTHGTPSQRGAAIDRGLTGARPQACQLATFH